MGVRSLSTFIKEWDKLHPEHPITVPVNLKELAEQCSGQAEIVIDGLNILGSIATCEDTICGGEYKYLASQVKDLITAFKDISLDLVFFFDGPTEISNVARFLTSKAERIQELENAFRNVEHTRVSEQTNVKYHPPLFFGVMKEVVKPMCKVICAEDVHDKEIAKYIIENENCVGIFSEDTDFLMYEGIPHIFSSQHLDLKSMTTKEYRQDILLQALSLELKAMPVFSTLMGNDFVTYEESKKYHFRTYGRMPLVDKVMIIARKSNQIHEKSPDDREQIAARLNTEIFHLGESKTDLILDSLKSYDCSLSSSETHRPCLTEWEKIVDVSVKKFFHEKMPSFVLLVLTRQRIVNSEKFIDRDFSHINILSELRRRIFRVLLHEKERESGGSEFVEEISGNYCRKFFPRPRRMQYKHLVRVLPVQDVPHPGLLHLWNGGEDLNEQRWMLVWWVLFGVGSNISFEQMALFRELPDHLMIESWSLLYIHMMGQSAFQSYCRNELGALNPTVIEKLSERDFVALLVMISAVPVLEAEQLGQYSAEYVKKRDVALALLYQETYMSVRTTMRMVGLNFHAELRDSYSGRLFHHLVSMEDPSKALDKMPPEACENYERVRKAMDRCGVFQDFQTDPEGFFLPTWSQATLDRAEFEKANFEYSLEFQTDPEGLLLPTWSQKTSDQAEIDKASREHSLDFQTNPEGLLLPTWSQQT